MEFGTIPREMKQRSGPGSAGKQVDQGEQTEAQRQAGGVGDADHAIDSANPATRVRVGEGEVGMAAVRAIEAETPDCTDPFGECGFTGGVPRAFEIALADTGESLGGKVNQVSEHPIGIAADANGSAGFFSI